VMDNLLSNSVKYTPVGGAIGMNLAVAADGRAEMTITDTGLGIAPDELPHLFDPYFRADEARHSGIPGTGLGMSIVRDIVTAHGGTIEVASRPGAGTTVTMRFPRRREVLPTGHRDRSASRPEQKEAV